MSAPLDKQETSETQERILAAAERLFAERGVAATSLRAVTAAADVNLAAVHYHFGSKKGLLRALIASRLAPVNRERLARLDQVESASADPAIEQLLEAFLRPVLAASRLSANRGVSALLFSEPFEIQSPLIVEMFGEVARRFIAALERALPELSREEVVERFKFVVAAMVHVVSGHHDIPVVPMGTAARSPQDRMRAMIHFLAAGLRAPALGTERGA